MIPPPQPFSPVDACGCCWENKVGRAGSNGLSDLTLGVTTGLNSARMISAKCIPTDFGITVGTILISVTST